MKDFILLILTASCAALFSWCFWYFLGKYAFDVLAITIMTTLFADNIRLRRKFKN